MSVITQDGHSTLMMAAQEGMTEVFSLLLKAGANIDLQNKVCQYMTYKSSFHNSHQVLYVYSSKRRMLNAILLI